MANNRNKKPNNTPLIVLAAGLILVVALIVVYGVIERQGASVPAETGTTQNQTTSAGGPSVTSGTAGDTEIIPTGFTTTESAITVIATTGHEVITTLQTTASEIITKTTAAETKKTTTTTAKKTTTTVPAKTTATESGKTYTEYSGVPYYKSANADRYEEYGKKNPKFTVEQVVTYVNIGLDKKPYTDVKKALNIDTKYILANKYFYMESNYVPANLKKFRDKYIGSGNTGNMMVAEAVDAFEKMSDAAAEQGLSILARSGYRSYDWQAAIYENYLKSDSRENVDTYSARPGYSEHQTGYAVDVCTKTVPYSKFDTTKEYQWAKDNIHKYGFVIHYTKANEWITGYMDEAWHFRYIGVEAATEIYKTGISVDEYIIRYHNK